MSNKSELAVSKFMEGFNCAQSVFYSFCDELSIDKELGLKTACGFGAGMGGKEEICGAVSGGIMVIGAKYGKIKKDDVAATEKTYKMTRELMDGFAKANGAYICNQLLKGCKLSTPEGQKEFKEKDYKSKICVPCVKSAVEILEKII
jgi:C_GCAxxG_C_C family probable redox protein